MNLENRAKKQKGSGKSSENLLTVTIGGLAQIAAMTIVAGISILTYPERLERERLRQQEELERRAREEELKRIQKEERKVNEEDLSNFRKCDYISCDNWYNKNEEYSVERFSAYYGYCSQQCLDYDNDD